MNFKLYVGAFALFATSLLILSACGGHVEAHADYEFPDEVENMAELKSYECDDNFIGLKIFVKDLNKNYECDGNNWIVSDDQKKFDANGKSLSSEAKSSSSSVAFVEPCRTDSVDNCKYGFLTDERDGQTYKTVAIGTQIWMAENLNYNAIDSYCYDDDTTNCAKYGRLYSWSTAMDSLGTWSSNGKGCGSEHACSPVYPVRGVCPEGWHLPEDGEWRVLFDAVGGPETTGKMLKSVNEWKKMRNHRVTENLDAYGFSVLSAGMNSVYGYQYEGVKAFFWTSTDMSEKAGWGYNDAMNWFMQFDDDGVYSLVLNTKTYVFSVRCLKNSD